MNNNQQNDDIFIFLWSIMRNNIQFGLNGKKNCDTGFFALYQGAGKVKGEAGVCYTVLV